MFRCLLFASALAVAMLTACQMSGTAIAEPLEHALGEEFPLEGGGNATIRDEDLDVRFSDVLEDSRCPTRVACFWTGQARIELVVTRLGREPETVEFNTNPAPSLNMQSVRVEDVTIELQSLGPYPQTPEDGLALADYRATLVVQRG